MVLRLFKVIEVLHFRKGLITRVSDLATPAQT